MKRYLLFVLFCITGLTLQAKDGDQLTLESGTANNIWNLTSAFFETDWSETTVEGLTWDEWLKSKGDDFVRDWPSDKRKVEDYFVGRFNKKTGKKRGLAIQTTNPNDAYYMVIRPHDIDMGSIGGGFVASAFLGAFAKKSGGVHFKSGYIDIIEAATGRIACRLSIKDVRGNSGISVNAQLMFVFEDLVDEIMGFANRFGNQQRDELYVDAVLPAAQPNVPQQATTRQNTPQQSGSQTGTVVAQTVQQVSVKLKSGATITGILKSFDPLSKIILIIAGQETTIPMEKVENVEMSQTAAPVSTRVRQTQRSGNIQSQTTARPIDDNRLGDKKLLVTETENYPERLTVDLGGTPIEMLLIKGGRMNMGFDGDHSMAMKSEPVHEVGVTSFYISSKPLSRQALTKYGKTKHDEMGNAVVEKYKDVQSIIDGIAKGTGKPYRIPTEAEWEYAACCDLQNDIFADVAKQKKIAYDWCSDFYDEFSTSSVIIDPTGPVSGNEHVVRAYNNKYGKLNRDNNISVGKYILGYIRLVIKAKDVK